MNVWNKVLMVLVTILCIVWGILAANRVNFSKEQAQKLEKLEKDLADAQEAVQKLRYEIYGGLETANEWREMGLDAQLDYMLALQHGEAFTNCAPVEARVDTTTMTSTASFTIDANAKTTSFRTGAVAFVFDSGAAVKKTASAATGDEATEDVSDLSESVADDSEGTATVVATAPYSFLGAFKVVGSTDTQVNLTSIGVSSNAELQALQASARSGNSWVVYADRLPVDSPADVARIFEENASSLAGLDAKTQQFVSQTYTIDDLEAANAESRMPVDFQGELEGQWAIREAGAVEQARKLHARETFTNIIADQWVAIGDKVVDEEILALDDWDDIYAAAQARKRVDSWREKIVKTESSLARMTGYRDLVKKTLDAANAGIAACEKAIADQIAANATLAAKIAQAQFLALEKIESESRTAYNN